MAAVNEDDHEQQVNQPEKKKPETEDEKRRKKIVPGSLMKAVARPGGGESRPAEGNQVIYHCAVRTLDGVIVESTRSEFGGKGTPRRHVLGKSKIILGLLEGIPTMLKGEVAVFKMKPEMHYGEKDCPVAVPDNFPKDCELHFEIELIEFSKVKVITDDLGVLKKVIKEGQSWETPREPYEVKAWISAKSGDGKVILSRTQDEPYFFTFGKSEVPKGLELGISTMPRGEKAVIYVKNQYYTESTLMPVVEGVDEVHFEVELVHFIQVRDVLGDGRLIKRRIRDGREINVHLFLHCKTAVNLWSMFLCLLGVSWVMPKTTFELLNSWKGIGKRRSKENWWENIPACIWWTLWKERNARCFHDNGSSTQKIKMKCLSLLYFWCKQDMVGEVESLVDFIGHL